MKKLLLVFTCLLGLVAAMEAESIAIKIDAGELENGLGTAQVPVGGLLELIASPSGTFSAPTSTSYVTGDNFVVATFAMNNNAGTAETINNLNVLPLSTGSTPPMETGYTLSPNYTLIPNETLLLRFYPSLTYGSQPTAPTLGTTYGQVRSDTIEFGAAGGDTRETTWIVPGSGSAVDFDYVTVSSGGTYGNTTAYATNSVLAGAVPEPTTPTLLAGTLVGLLGLRVWNGRKVSALAASATEIN